MSDGLRPTSARCRLRGIILVSRAIGKESIFEVKQQLSPVVIVVVIVVVLAIVGLIGWKMTGSKGATTEEAVPTAEEEAMSQQMLQQTEGGQPAGGSAGGPSSR